MVFKCCLSSTQLAPLRRGVQARLTPDGATSGGRVQHLAHHRGMHGERQVHAVARTHGGRGCPLSPHSFISLVFNPPPPPSLVFCCITSLSPANVCTAKMSTPA